MKDVLIKPLMTEKASALNESGKYAFIVNRKANKIEIRRAVEEMYSVSITDVRTMNYQGKKKSRYSKSAVITGSKPNFKKAIVSVADGEVIDFYGNV